MNALVPPVPQPKRDGTVISLSLLLLPDLVAIAGLLIGACAVGAGFMWTMAEFYIPQQPPPDA